VLGEEAAVFNVQDLHLPVGKVEIFEVEEVLVTV
jgi:hypothetical protein